MIHLTNLAASDRCMDVVWIEMSLQRTDRLLLGCVNRSPNSSLEEDC